jgi:tetratricopeptide (TPR) repeat protein
MLALYLVSLSLLGCRESATSYLQKGKDLYSAGQYEKAELNFRKAAQIQPDLAEAHYRRGLALQKQGKSVDAYRVFLRASALAPDLLDAKVQVAEMSLEAYLTDPSHPRDMYERAKKLSEDLLARNPKSLDGLRLEGNLALVDRRPEEALAIFRKANEIQPLSPEIVHGMVQALAETKRLSEAESLALALIAKQKDYGQIYDDLYTLYQSAGRAADAEKILQTKIANNPSVAAYRLQLAAHLLNNNRPQEMEAALRPLIEDSKTFPAGRLDAAEFYMRAEKWPEAAALLQQTTNLDKAGRLRALKLQAKALLAQGKTAESAKAIDAALRESPRDSEARFVQASLWVELKDSAKSAEALRELDAARSERKSDPMFWQILGKAYLLAGDPAKAVPAFETASRLSPSFKPSRVALAELNLTTRPSAALQYADEARAIDPNDGAVRVLRATALLALNRLKEAEAELTTVLKAVPNYRDARLQLAFVHLADKQFAQAESEFKTLHQSGDDDLRALGGLAQTYLLQSQADRAIALLNAELQQSPKPNEIRRLLGRVALAIKRPDLAEQQYREILRSEPRSVPDQYQLAEALRAKGDLPGAVATLESVVRSAPEDPVPASMLAFLLQQAGRNQEAIAQLRRVLELRSDDPNTLNNLAYLLAESGSNLDEALSLAQKAVRAVPADLSYADTLGWVYLKKKNADAALQTFEVITRKAPQNPTYLFHLALAQLEKGQRDHARSTLELALAKKPAARDESRIRELLSGLGR